MKRGSRKRCRGSSSCGGASIGDLTGGLGCSNNQISCAFDTENDTVNGAECFLSESGLSRSSVHVIHDVVSNFDRQKASLVEEAGFGGILHFPPIKQFNRRFALWLMTSVNALARTLNIGDHISIKFSKSDVYHMLGIPCNGKVVLDSRLPVRDAKERVLNKFLGPRFKEHRSIKVVQEIIEREYSVPMGKEEAETFKVAFVVFVVSSLLAPSAKHDYASIDYWNALADPGSLHTYDWSDFVVVKIVEAVMKLKEDIASNVKFPIITGCSIFIQVLYLDSLDLEGSVLRHNTFPRIRDFSYERTRLMISADRNFTRYVRADDHIPCVKLRDPAGCVYSWAFKWRDLCEESKPGSLFAIWEAAIAMAQLLDIPLPAAGPLFIAAADFHTKVNSGLPMTGSQALKFMSVLTSIMIPYKRGHRAERLMSSESGDNIVGDYVRNGICHLAEPRTVNRKADCGMLCGECLRNGNDVDKPFLSRGLLVDEVRMCGIECTEIGEQVQSSYDSVMSSNQEVRDYNDVDKRVASAMSQFYSVIRGLKSSREFDLNSCVGECQNGAASSSVASSSTVVVPSPWEIGYKWVNRDIDLGELSRQFSPLHGYDGMVIVHRLPKYIQLSGTDLYRQAFGDCEMEQDLFDSLVRTLRQQDDELYGAHSYYRWRRIFESDIMACMLSGSGCMNASVGSGNVPGVNMAIDMTACKIAFFPAFLQCTWVCFAWALEENVIFVFEPSQSKPVDGMRVSLLERACNLLKIGLDSMFRDLFDSGRKHPQNAVVRMLTLSDSGRRRLNRTGALCYMFCCCFDGYRLLPDLSVLDNSLLTAKILEGCIELKENSGKFPELVVQSL